MRLLYVVIYDINEIPSSLRRLAYSADTVTKANTEMALFKTIVPKSSTIDNLFFSIRVYRETFTFQ